MARRCISADLEEYAFLIRGFFSLFEAGRAHEWLKGLWSSPKSCTHLKLRMAPFIKLISRRRISSCAKAHLPTAQSLQEMPSTAKTCCACMTLPNNPSYLEQAEDIFRAVGKSIESYSPGYAYHAFNLIRYHDAHRVSAVIALNEQEQYSDELRQLLYRSFIRSRTIIWRREGDRPLFQLSPFVQQQKPINGKTTLYLCRKGVCMKPLTEISEIMAEIRKL